MRELSGSMDESAAVRPAVTLRIMLNLVVLMRVATISSVGGAAVCCSRHMRNKKKKKLSIVHCSDGGLVRRATEGRGFYPLAVPFIFHSSAMGRRPKRPHCVWSGRGLRSGCAVANQKQVGSVVYPNGRQPRYFL